MRSLAIIFAVVLLCSFAVVRADDDDASIYFDRSAVIQALGQYGNGINALAKLSDTQCPHSNVFGNTALLTQTRAFINANYHSTKTKWFRTTGGLNFTVGATGFLGTPLPTTAALLENLAGFYNFIFTLIFVQPNHWLYSTPTVTFSTYDAEFGCATATLIAENESRGFNCGGYQTLSNGTVVVPGNLRAFQMFYGTFVHKFCWETRANRADSGWKICGFFEDNKGSFQEEGSQLQRSSPVCDKPGVGC
jgi:hypothetical protein